MEESHFQQSDRDLLVELRTQMKFLLAEIKDMKDLNKSEISTLKDDVSDIQAWRENLTGKYTIFAILGGILISVITAIVTNIFTR